VKNRSHKIVISKYKLNEIDKLSSFIRVTNSNKGQGFTGP